MDPSKVALSHIQSHLFYILGEDSLTQQSPLGSIKYKKVVVKWKSKNFSGNWFSLNDKQ